MFSFFKPSPRKMRDQQLHDAECSLVQHKRSAAYHAAMVTYLSGEVGRMQAEVAAEKEVARINALATPVSKMAPAEGVFRSQQAGV